MTGKPYPTTAGPMHRRRCHAAPESRRSPGLRSAIEQRLDLRHLPRAQRPERFSRWREPDIDVRRRLAALGD
ncbi:MAG: hypothetical protein ACXVYM_08265, partial [Gaiellaceae bacterium]